MSEFTDRVRTALADFSLRDQKTQLALTSAAAALILIVAAVAIPLRDDDAKEDVAAERDDQATVDDLDTSDPEATDEASQAPRGRAPSNATVGAPADPSVPGIAIAEGFVKVGIAFLSDPGTANAAAGFGGIGQIDQKRAWEAVIKQYNANPPFARKIVPVYYSFTTDELTSKGVERVEQEACAHWTKDNKVFLVWGGALGLDTLSSCLTEAKVPLIGGGSSSRATFEKYPYLVDPTGKAMERMAEFEVDNLVAQNFFDEFKDNDFPYTPQVPTDKKARIGLIRYDTPEFKAGGAAMKARLAKHGLALCSGCEFEISYSADNIQEQLDDATEVNAAIQNCKSRPDGPCTHMLFLGTTAGVRLTLFFADGAEKQQYRPRLGFNPEDAPTAVRDFYGETSYPQMRDSMVVSDNPGAFEVQTEAFQECKKLIEDAGESFQGDEAANKEGQIIIQCNDAWYTRGVFEKVGVNLNLETFMDGVHSVAPIPSASVYRMQTKVGRRDGSGAVRVGEWRDDCACWKPITGIIPV
jgi:hypothetical protein